MESGRPAELGLLAAYVGVQCVAALAWAARRPDETGAAQFAAHARNALERLGRGGWAL